MQLKSCSFYVYSLRNMKVLISVSVSPKDKIFNEIFNQESQFGKVALSKVTKKAPIKVSKSFLKQKYESTLFKCKGKIPSRWRWRRVERFFRVKKILMVRCVTQLSVSRITAAFCSTTNSAVSSSVCQTNRIEISHMELLVVHC